MAPVPINDCNAISPAYLIVSISSFSEHQLWVHLSTTLYIATRDVQY